MSLFIPSGDYIDIPSVAGRHFSLINLKIYPQAITVHIVLLAIDINVTYTILQIYSIYTCRRYILYEIDDTIAECCDSMMDLTLYNIL